MDTKQAAAVLIVHRYPFASYGLASLMADESGLSVCDRLHEGKGVVGAVRSEAPDLVMLDAELPEASALSLVDQVKVEESAVQVLVMSGHEEPFFADRFLRAGADGYVAKDEPTESILEAAHAVLQGNVALSDSVLTGIVRQQTGRGGWTSTVSDLSNREMEVFQMLGRGLKTTEVAERLYLSPKTVHYYRDQIKDKLDIDHATELAYQAFKWVHRHSLLPAGQGGNGPSA